jgi:serine/threonine-protein kinase
VSRNSLNVSVPMSHPPCDGSGIVVLANAVTPGQYDAAIQQYLNMFPGASYLRTDESCPSLRQRDDAGNPIYAVYRPAGRTQSEVCAAVRAAGGEAYGKWLDLTTNPRYMIPC